MDVCTGAEGEAAFQATSGSTEAGRTYCVRWHVMMIWLLAAFVNQSMWLTFAPVVDPCSRMYNVPRILFSSFATCGTLTYIPGTWWFSRMLEKSDLRRVVLTASTLAVLGVVLRFFAHVVLQPLVPRFGYAVLFIGQCLVCIGAPAFLQNPALFGEIWFSQKERDLISSVAMLVPRVGQGFGPFLATLCVRTEDATGLSMFLGIQMAVSILLGWWVFWKFDAAPPTPPTVAAARNTRIGARSASESTFALWLKLFRRPQYMLLWSVFTVGVCCSSCLLSLYDDFAGKCGYGTAIGGFASLAYMSAGVVGLVVTGLIIGKAPAYRSALKSTTTLAVCAGSALFLGMHEKATVSLLLCTAFFGMTMLSVIPCIFACAVEETYPMPTEASTGLLTISTILLQVPAIPLLSAVLNNQGNECLHFSPAHIIVVTMSLLFCLCPALLYKGKYRRMEAEQCDR
mmetsp:Transcript_57143/g.113594  ORF Transcript_57143/g.113594 Transcript_57143/m.113594 type:complete len:456 (-) Transcript_57143:25-1392(-)